VRLPDDVHDFVGIVDDADQFQVGGADVALAEHGFSQPGE
jgi:hypothetical protein